MKSNTKYAASIVWSLAILTFQGLVPVKGFTIISKTSNFASSSIFYSKSYLGTAASMNRFDTILKMNFQEHSNLPGEVQTSGLQKPYKREQMISEFEEIEDILECNINSTMSVDEREECIQTALKVAKEQTKSIDENSLSATNDYTTDISLSENIVLILGSAAIAILLSYGLSSFEWLQSWRYSWCLVGFLYIWDGLQNNPILVPSKSKVFNIIEIMCGVGLLIGGAFDAFMPVYMTGPNVVTNAGIHQDSATALLGLSLWNFCTSTKSKIPSLLPSKLPSSISFEMGTYDRKLLQMILLGQLYILAESSIDEILSYF